MPKNLPKDFGGSPAITDNLAYVLAQAHRDIHLRLEKLLKTEGAQVEHWRILEVLSDEKGRSMGELATIVLMNHPALTKMLDRMVANGLVHRSPDPADNRRVLVFVTDAGLAHYRRVRAHVETLNGEIEMTIGPKKMRDLKRLLGDVIGEET